MACVPGSIEVLRAQRPFWLHQLVEYLIGIVLVSASFQTPDPGLPAVLGVLILVNAAIVIGPVGAFRLVTRRLHRQLDLVVIALLVVGAVQPWLTVEGTTRLLLGVIAVVMFSVWFHTDFAERSERKQRRAAAAPASSEELGRRAGRLAGQGVRAIKKRRNG